jgi:DNA-binding LacI/PurR family transcriptional regulator
MDKIRRKQVTMEDVAKKAGVSVTTVSHVVNKTASISEPTALRVREAMTALGYVPRTSAELNRGQRLIAVFVPDISNEFYAQSMQAIFDEAWRHDYAVMVCSMRHHHQAETSYIRSLIQSSVRGFIFFGGSSDDEKQILDAARHVPVVLGDRRLRSGAVDSVGTDNLDVVRRLITRLARAGYSRIGYVSEDLIMSNTYDRSLGFRQGMEENGLPIDERWVFFRQELRLNKAESAYSFFLSVLEKSETLPQILLCTSDLIAVGVISALKARGYRVPLDVGVIGFDNISIAAFTEPPLTTIAQDMKQLGCSCFDALLRRMDDPDRTPQEVVVRAKLVVRGSARL